jgi:hypothetical protein
MMKQLLIILFALTLNQARADDLFVGGSIGVMGPGLQFGWESDQNFGVRFAAGTIWGAGIFVGADIYGQWKINATRWYFGAGATTVVLFATQYIPARTYVAPELLMGFAYELAPKSELFFEWNPGLAVYQNPPPGFEEWPVVPVGLFIRIQLGYRYRF